MSRPKEFDPDQVLDRAMEVFWEKGYDSASLRELEGRMGINRFSIYSTFESKHALFLRALDRYRDRVVTDWVRPLEQSDEGVGAIRAYLEGLVELAASGEAWHGCLMTNSTVELGSDDTESAERLRAHLRRLENAFYSALLRARERGEVGTDRDPRATARFLTGSAQGLVVLSRVFPEREVLMDHVEGVLSSLT